MLVLGVIVVAFVSVAGQKKLDQLASTWSDEELVHRLQKYENLLLVQAQARHSSVLGRRCPVSAHERGRVI